MGAGGVLCPFVFTGLLRVRWDAFEDRQVIDLAGVLAGNLLGATIRLRWEGAVGIVLCLPDVFGHRAVRALRAVGVRDPVLKVRHYIEEQALLGRVGASAQQLVFGALPLGALTGGLLAHHLGNRPTMWLTGVLQLATIALLRPLWRPLADQSESATSTPQQHGSPAEHHT